MSRSSLSWRRAFLREQTAKAKEAQMRVAEDRIVALC